MKNGAPERRRPKRTETKLERQTEMYMRILIVDDNEDSCDLTEAALLSAGYSDICVAHSAWEAFKQMDVGWSPKKDGAQVDIVLLDIVMPEVDGIEACARIRNDARYADIPIIMVTSVDDIDSLANAFVAGASDYITKPVNRVELLARVRAALKLKTELERRLARERELLVFMSTWGERRASVWVDNITGLFVGEVAEAYLMATNEAAETESSAVVVLAIDRLEAYRAAKGDNAVRSIQARVAQAVRRLTANVGVIAAAYRNGLIMLVGPELSAEPARQLGEQLCETVSSLDMANSESIAADHVTASVAVATGPIGASFDRMRLLTNAISTVRDVEAAGGNRVVAVAV
jgi:PleD family two-component response regulator